MMRRLRIRTGPVVIALLVTWAFCASMAVGDLDPVIPPHNHPDVLLTTLLWMIGGAVTIVGAVAAITSYILHTRKELFEAEMAAIAERKLEAHNLDRDAHAIASRANHDPMFEIMTEMATTQSLMEEELDIIAEEHATAHPGCAFDKPDEERRIIIEKKLCALREKRKNRQRRDPLDTIARHRKTDASGDDYRAMRGKQ